MTTRNLRTVGDNDNLCGLLLKGFSEENAGVVTSCLEAYSNELPSLLVLSFIVMFQACFVLGWNAAVYFFHNL